MFSCWWLRYYLIFQKKIVHLQRKLHNHNCRWSKYLWSLRDSTWVECQWSWNCFNPQKGNLYKRHFSFRGWNLLIGLTRQVDTSKLLMTMDGPTDIESYKYSSRFHCSLPEGSTQSWWSPSMSWRKRLNHRVEDHNRSNSCYDRINGKLVIWFRKEIYQS